MEGVGIRAGGGWKIFQKLISGGGTIIRYSRVWSMYGKPYIRIDASRTISTSRIRTIMQCNAEVNETQQSCGEVQQRTHRGIIIRIKLTILDCKYIIVQLIAWASSDSAV